MYAPDDFAEFQAGPDTAQKRKYEQLIRDVSENEIVLIPFFPSTPTGSVHPDDIEETPMLVELRPGNY